MYLNVVAFQVPNPPNYGGVIDVYYRLKTLKEQGVKVILHCFYYGGRSGNADLEALVEKVYYYKRPTGFIYQLTATPYIVRTRSDKRLLENLCLNDYPILFEGLHCCYFLNNEALKSRQKWVRMHNVEHEYYKELSKAAESVTDRLFFSIESCKLRRFEKVLHSAQVIFAISESDSAYFQKNYPYVTTLLLPACHAEAYGIEIPDKSSGEYCLYHANFGVAENVKVAEYLIENIAGKIDMPLYIAGLNANKLKATEQVRLINNIDDDELLDLVTKAKANLLMTFQSTGLKLKLMNALNFGGFCVVNSKMLSGTQLEPTCIVANSKDDIINAINGLKKKSWTLEDETLRQQTIEPYSNRQAVQALVSLYPVSPGSAIGDKRHSK